MMRYAIYANYVLLHRTYKDLQDGYITQMPPQRYSDVDQIEDILKTQRQKKEQMKDDNI